MSDIEVSIVDKAAERGAIEAPMRPMAHTARRILTDQVPSQTQRKNGIPDAEGQKVEWSIGRIRRDGALPHPQDQGYARQI